MKEGLPTCWLPSYSSQVFCVLCGRVFTAWIPCNKFGSTTFTSEVGASHDLCDCLVWKDTGLNLLTVSALRICEPFCIHGKIMNAVLKSQMIEPRIEDHTEIRYKQNKSEQ